MSSAVWLYTVLLETIFKFKVSDYPRHLAAFINAWDYKLTLQSKKGQLRSEVMYIDYKSALQSKKRSESLFVVLKKTILQILGSF